MLVRSAKVMEDEDGPGAAVGLRLDLRGIDEPRHRQELRRLLYRRHGAHRVWVLRRDGVRDGSLQREPRRRARTVVAAIVCNVLPPGVGGCGREDEATRAEHCV